MPVLSRRLLLPLSVSLVAACNPLDCQGKVDRGFEFVKDEPILTPLCGGNATNVENGDINVTSQKELDLLVGCTSIDNGSIFIHDSDDIKDLAALAAMKTVNNGYILLFNNSALENVQLPELETIGTGFAAIDNPVLTAVNLPALTTLEGDLTMRNNPIQTQVAIPNVEVLANADRNGKVFFGNLILGDVPALTSLEGGFTNLRVIEGFLQVYNTGLTNFTGLGVLEEIQNTGGQQTEPFKQRVDKLNPGLSVGIDFDSDFNIVPAGNANLENFAGLEALDVIGGDLLVAFNPEFTNFTGLDDIKVVENLWVFENDSMTSFLGLEGDENDDNDNDGLSQINKTAFIGLYFDRFGKAIAGGNDALVDLDGMQSLLRINGDLILAFNASMEDLNGLTDFNQLGGDLVFLGQNMDSLKGAEVLTTIGGDLNFGQLLRQDGQPFDPQEDEADKKLTDIFNKDTVVTTAVKFDPGVDGANGFDALTTVNGNLIVAFSDLNNLQLSDPDDGEGGGANLTTVAGSLLLYGNDQPDSLEGIQTLNALGGLVINFAIDGFGDLQPFDNNGLNEFSDLDVDLGAGGLILGFDDDIDGAGFATFRDFGTIQGDVIMASVDNENDRGPVNLNDLNVNNIGGDFVICAIKNGNDAPIEADLDNLTALNLNTVNVGGDLIIAFCTNLTNTTMNTANVGGSFEMTELPELATINGINALTTAGEVLLHDLVEVTTINIPALANVSGNVELVNNAKLENFDFALNNVGGTVRLVDLGELADLGGLTGMNNVGGDLEVIDCETVTDTVGLNQLDTVGGNLILRRLDSITNEARDGGQQELTFNQLTTVGGIELTQMNNLEDLAGLQNLDVVEGNLTLNNNEKLKTLFGLQGITTIGRKLSIVGNPVLDTAFFDDDDQDREVDIDDQDGNNNEPEDPDATPESGLGAEIGNEQVLQLIGDPEILDGVVIGGQTGVVELRDNPNFDEAEFLSEVVDGLDNYAGLIFLCGNDGSVDNVNEEDRLVSFAVCADADDGVIDLFNGADGGEEGEGEGE